jgi:SAM-dependent methyltransferase
MDPVPVFRPEIGAGGYARDDTTIEFYFRMNALLDKQSRVLDFGAGRGSSFDRDAGAARNLQALRGKVALLAGVDIDSAIQSNPSLDEAHVIGVDQPVPYENSTFDLVFCDWVVEHVENVPFFVAEIGRVLKPGGWFCARTPNKWGYIALGARLTPPIFEHRVLKAVQPDRLERDVFPKRYRLNTLRQIAGAFPAPAWRHFSYATAATPAYHGGHRLLFQAIDLFQKLMPSSMGTVLMVFIRKAP